MHMCGTHYSYYAMKHLLFIAVNYLQGLDHQYKLLSHQLDASVVAHHVPVCA